MGCFLRFGEKIRGMTYPATLSFSMMAGLPRTPPFYPSRSLMPQVSLARFGGLDGFFSDFLAPEVPFLVKKNGEKDPI